ncbi:492_t:CDS:2 [Dentiscutata heterogama]|uniref:492_t:CDS:1 n=1 Tax=Dentiscutata heterogama TaxID=1316150 RepID=A0ACA9KAY4_9GLOM|nr:492_t:CDS:2 [Dentiscutata heterogama]
MNVEFDRISDGKHEVMLDKSLALSLVPTHTPPGKGVVCGVFGGYGLGYEIGWDTELVKIRIRLGYEFGWEANLVGI